MPDMFNNRSLQRSQNTCLKALCCSLAIWLSGGIIGLAGEVVVTTLDGQQIRGELIEISSKTLTLMTNDQLKTLAREELLELEQTADQEYFPPLNEKQMIVTLVNGSQMKVTKLERKTAEIMMSGALIDEIKLTPGDLSDVLIEPLPGELIGRWYELKKQQQSNLGAGSDYLVVKKNDNLDFVSGVVGNINEKGVEFLLGERTAVVPWEKLFGVIFLQKQLSTPRGYVVMQTRDGLKVNVETVEFLAGTYRCKVLGQSMVSINPESLERIDFSAGKIKFLSDLAPVIVELTPFFDRRWEPGFDRNTHGKPLMIGLNSYRKGVSLHAKTEMTYRLAGAYREFQCQAGLDQSINPRIGDVNLTIKGDGKVLFEQNFSVQSTRSQYVRPQSIRVNLTGINDLTFLVDFGSDRIDIGDTLNLADAKLLR